MKNGIICFMLGVLVSGIVAYAGVVLSSDKVSYNDATVKDSLDNLFNDSLNGKNNIITALQNKGFSVADDSTYNEIVDSINNYKSTCNFSEGTVKATGTYTKTVSTCSTKSSSSGTWNEQGITESYSSGSIVVDGIVMNATGSSNLGTITRTYDPEKCQTTISWTGYTNSYVTINCTSGSSSTYSYDITLNS